MAARLTIAGIGNRWRGDDALGVTLVERLADAPPAGVECRLWEAADALTLAHELLGLATPVLVVDAADLGAPPATWRLLAADEVRLHDPCGSASTHGLRLATGIELAQALGFDRRLWLFAVQPDRCEVGAGLSPALAAALDSLIEALRAAARERAT